MQLVETQMQQEQQDINVNKILVIVYSLCGLLAGFGALNLSG